MIENRICEGTDCLQAAISSGVTGLQVQQQVFEGGVMKQ